QAQLVVAGVATLDLQERIEESQHVPVHRSHERGQPALVLRVSPPRVVAGAVVVTPGSGDLLRRPRSLVRHSHASSVVLLSLLADTLTSVDLFLHAGGSRAGVLRVPRGQDRRHFSGASRSNGEPALGSGRPPAPVRAPPQATTFCA